MILKKTLKGDSGSSVHSGRAGSSPASHTKPTKSEPDFPMGDGFGFCVFCRKQFFPNGMPYRSDPNQEAPAYAAVFIHGRSSFRTEKTATTQR